MMPKKFVLLSILSILGASVNAGEVIELWPNGAPNKSSITASETTDAEGTIFNVTKARMEVEQPSKSNGKAVILIPGGGYGNLSMGVIENSYKPFFLEEGFTVFILKYRLPKGNPAIPLSDANEAVKVARSLASKYKFKQVGVMGASAGGHLAAMASVRCEGLSCPDFSVLVYPNITMIQEETLPKSSCRNNLIGSERSVKYDTTYSAYKHVGLTTPQAFLAVSAQDEYAGSLGSMLYARAMIENNRPVSLHIYPTGNHAWGIEKSKDFPDGDNFRRDLSAWLRMLK